MEYRHAEAPNVLVQADLRLLVIGPRERIAFDEELDEIPGFSQWFRFG